MLLRYTAVVPIMSYAASYALHVAYRVLYAMCCMLYPACCMPYAACCTYVVCCVLHAACCMLRVAGWALYVARCVLSCCIGLCCVRCAAVDAPRPLQRRHAPRTGSDECRPESLASAEGRLPHKHTLWPTQPNNVRMHSARTDAPTSPRTHSSMAPNGSATCEADRRNATHDVATLQSCSAGCVRSAPTGAMTSCTASASSGAI